MTFCQFKFCKYYHVYEYSFTITYYTLHIAFKFIAKYKTYKTGL